MKFEQFKTNVERWQDERGIYEHSTALAQALKGVSEAGELADAVIKGDRDALKDSVGYVMVCLVGVAKMLDIGIAEPDEFDAYPFISYEYHAARAACFVSEVADDLAFDSDPEAMISIDPARVEYLIGSAIDHLGSISFELGLTLMECCESAWNEIKDRKGKMVAGGAFVKDGEA